VASNARLGLLPGSIEQTHLPSARRYPKYFIYQLSGLELFSEGSYIAYPSIILLQSGDMEGVYCSACCSGRVNVNLRENRFWKLIGNEKCRPGVRGRWAPRAGMGFTEMGSELVLPSQKLAQVSPEYGLSVGQMRVLGISNDSFSKMPEVEPVRLQFLPPFFSQGGSVWLHFNSLSDFHSLLQSTITAKAFYVGDQVDETKRQAVRMAVDTKAPGQAPPDLPSLLLDGRICYIGMPVRFL